MKTTLSGEKHSCYQNYIRKTTNKKNASNPHKCWMQEKACHPHGTNKPFPNVWHAALSAPARESAPSSFPSLNCKVAARCRLGRAATSQFREGKEEGGDAPQARPPHRCWMQEKACHPPSPPDFISTLKVATLMLTRCVLSIDSLASAS